MGILVKFLIEDGSKEINIVVQNTSKGTTKDLLDVVVPLTPPTDKKNDKLDDLINIRTIPSWRSRDELEQVLGEELGKEINNITSNVVSSLEPVSNSQNESLIDDNHPSVDDSGVAVTINDQSVTAHEITNNEDDEALMELDSEIDQCNPGEDCEVNSETVDLTEERENIQSRPDSINSTEQEVCIVQFSDDEDTRSEYSSWRKSPSIPRRRTKSFNAISPDIIDSSPRAISSPEDLIIETVYDDDFCSSDEYEPATQVVDLTATEGKIDIIDLTESASTINFRSPAIAIDRSPDVVMNDIKNLYAANKDAIAASHNAILRFGDQPRQRVGIQAPPKLNNCLGRDDVDGLTDCIIAHTKSLVGGRRSASGLRERNTNASRAPPIKPLIKVPPPVCGPAGYRVNDDLGEPPSTIKPEEYAADGHEMHENRIPTLLSSNFNGLRRQRPGMRSNGRKFGNAYHRRMAFNPRFRLNNGNHVSPLLRREQRQRQATRSAAAASTRLDPTKVALAIQPTSKRGEVWIN